MSTDQFHWLYFQLLAMAQPAQSLMPLLRVSRPRCPGCLRSSAIPQQSVRAASNSANAAKYKRKDESVAAKRKKKGNVAFTMPDLRLAEQFSLCDAMRYAQSYSSLRASRLTTVH